MSRKKLLSLWSSRIRGVSRGGCGDCTLDAGTNYQTSLCPEDIGITHALRDYARLHGMGHVGILAHIGRDCGGTEQASLNQSRCESQ